MVRDLSCFSLVFLFFLCIIISVVVPGFCRVFTILPTVVPEGSMRVIRSMVLELSPVTFGEIRGSVYAEYKLRVLDQINGKHFERTGMSTLFFLLQLLPNLPTKSMSNVVLKKSS